MNKVILCGRVGADSELKTFDNGGAVLSFSLATNDVKKVNDQYEDITDWHKIQLSGKRATSLESFIKKGTGLLIEGKSKVRTFKDEKGETKYIHFIQASNIEFTFKSEKKDVPF